MPKPDHNRPTIQVQHVEICEGSNLQMLLQGADAVDELPDSLISFLELHAPVCVGLRAQTTRTDDEKRERWRNSGVALRCDPDTDVLELAAGVVELSKHVRAESNVNRVRIIATCNEAPRRRRSGSYVVTADGFEEYQRGGKSESNRDEYNDMRQHARADSRAMMAIVIESAQAVQQMTSTLGESLAKIWETQASHANSHNDAFAKVEIAKLDHAARAQELAAETEKNNRLMGMLGQVAPAIAAHIKTGGDPSATLAAMPAAPDTQTADTQEPTHGPKTAEISAILMELDDAGIETLAAVVGPTHWEPLWSALQSDADKTAQETAVVACLESISKQIDTMTAEQKNEAITKILSLGAPAFRLHSLFTAK